MIHSTYSHRETVLTTEQVLRGARLRAAAYHAKRAYPGAIGELLARELTAHAEFGYRFADGGLLTRLAAEVMGTPVT